MNFFKNNFIDLVKITLKIIINIPKIFDVVNSMNSKTSYGGTATKNIKGMIKKYRKEALWIGFF